MTHKHVLDTEQYRNPLTQQLEGILFVPVSLSHRPTNLTLRLRAIPDKMYDLGSYLHTTTSKASASRAARMETTHTPDTPGYPCSFYSPKSPILTSIGLSTSLNCYTGDGSTTLMHP